jgi:hypothetical protein
MVFLDEAGTGNPRVEPYVVVAGVIVHADKQWKAVESHLAAMMAKYSPIPVGDLPHNYSFHATELFSGGKVFTRERFSKEQRWAILDELVSLPAKFELPVVARQALRSEAKDVVDAYRYCFMEVSAQVEAYMRLLPDRSEVASIIAEDLPAVHYWVDSFHRFQQSHIQNTGGLHAHHRDRLWLTRVIGRPHFEGKSMYSPLQIADACAFAIKRQLMEKPDAGRFYAPLVPMLIDCANPRPGS